MWSQESVKQPSQVIDTSFQHAMLARCLFEAATGLGLGSRSGGVMSQPQSLG